MNSHYADLNVSITNMDGTDTEIDHVTEIIVGALRSAGYKSYVSVDKYGAYEQRPAEQPAAAPAVPEADLDTAATAIPEAAVNCTEWRMSNGRADVCPMSHCRRCRHMDNL